MAESTAQEAATTVDCPVCQRPSKQKWKLAVLEKHQVQYYECHSCGLLFTEKPYWLAEAYSSAINTMDTGILQRNFFFRDVTAVTIFAFLDPGRRFLDYAGGYGIMVRLMRDLGLDFFWFDPYAQNLMARGFEWNSSHKKKLELVTCFEALEHMENPRALLLELSKISDTILISTELKPSNVPKDWWYLGPKHGQHIQFHTKESLQYLARELGFSVVSHRGLHLFTKQRKIPTAFWALLVRSSRMLLPILRIFLSPKTQADHLTLSKEGSSSIDAKDIT